MSSISGCGMICRALSRLLVAAGGGRLSRATPRRTVLLRELSSHQRPLDKGEILEKEQMLCTADVGTTAAAAVVAGTVVVPMETLERRPGVGALRTTAEWASLRAARFQGSSLVRDA